MFGYFIAVPILLVTFFLMVKYRERLTSRLLMLPFSNYKVFLLITTVLILIEENVNDGFPYWIMPFVPWTLPIILLQVMFFAWIMNKWNLSVKTIMISFITFGVLWEVFFGPTGIEWGETLSGMVSTEENPVYPVWWMVWTTIFMGISYAYFSLIPFMIRKRSKKG